MARSTKCIYCGVSFDRDKVEGVQIGQRWAHSTCYKQKEKEKSEVAKLKVYIGELFSGNINWGLVNKQINNYLDKGYKPSGIQGTLHYCYIIKRMNIQKANGIGIVEYYYKQAGDYFMAMGRMEQVQKVEITTREVIISEPTAEKLTRLKPIALEELMDE